MASRNDNDDDNSSNMEAVEVDDDDDEEEQAPRRQHKYTTRDLQPERPWKRYALTALACIVIVVIMVLLSIFLQKMFDPDEDDDWDKDNANNVTDDDQAGAVTGVSQLLPKDAEFIQSVCSREKIGSEVAEDRASCEQECTASIDCCTPGSNSTCFVEQTAGCVSYAPCQALGGINEPPPVNLDRLCSAAALEVGGRAECEFVCSPMICCYQETDSCLASKFWTCLDYAPCQNLKTSPTAVDDPSALVEVALASLDTECQDDTGVCTRACRDVPCCSDPSNPCYRDNFLACLTYSSCPQFKPLEPANTIVPEAPADLEDICFESKIGTDAGRQACTDACTPAACCSVDGADGCFGNDPMGCLQYQICANLQ